MYTRIVYFLIGFLCLQTFAQQADPLITRDSLAQRVWVDSIMNEMSIEQKIGQLFMVQAYSNKDIQHKEGIKKIIKNHHIGGLIFMQGAPEKQVLLTNTYQSISKIPLFIGIDGEWGLDMRLTNTYRYPWNMTLGAIQNDELIEAFGKRLGEQCNRMGIHMNFAPVVDVNINPKNPIIGNRSFGEDPNNVNRKSIAFVKGLQAMNVIATAKHFPGHGDTASDSHKTLPQLNFSRSRLEKVELLPYRGLIENSLTGIMVAHLGVPALEKNHELPTSLSFNVTTTLLQKEMAFKGLVVTDALNMKGASNFAAPGEIDLAALLAGNDILLVPQDVPAAVLRIKQALENKVLTEERLDYSVRKILKGKYWSGLHEFDFVDPDGLVHDLNTVEDLVLHRKLVENAITVVKDEGGLIPLKELDNNKIAYIKFGEGSNKDFVGMLKNYTSVDEIYSEHLNELLAKLKSYDLVIVGFHKSNENPWKDYSFKDKELVWLEEIARNNKVILNVFSSPYSLQEVNTFKNIEAIVLSYQNSQLSQEISGQVIFGALESKGKLPVGIGKSYPSGTGILTPSIGRLGYSIPEAVAMNSSNLKKIDSVVQVVLNQRMAPGVQVLVGRKGQIIYNKSFGFHTDRKITAVKNSDIFDLASMTKILASLPLIMELEEKGILKLDSRLGSLLPELRGSNKEELTVREVLSHTARLMAWIPFYLETLDSVSQQPSTNYYRKTPSADFKVQVANELFLRNDYQDSIMKLITEAEQRERPGYKYSDLSFYLFKKYIERYYGRNLNELTYARFYAPLGAYHLTYLPLEKFDENRIVPSEDDQYFRYQELRGYVHDMGAAMQGGIGGHAGLFGNANDVAKMMQMYLQGGYYGGVHFFDKETIDKFNYRYYDEDKNRRGLIFDKPQLVESEEATCGCVSDHSFGHSGFTGTYTWADPESEIIYVFLSNRVYPTMENKGLIKENIRTKIQQIIQYARLDLPE
jgi:beta-glucosidase-like glycosyl hydrolase/CubicO group peptidase (beta-lactamase class C family)